MQTPKRGILYLAVHNQLTKKAGINRILYRKEIFCILGRLFLVPKNLRDAVIKEMEDMKLLKKESRGVIKILKCNIDIHNDINKLYKMVGLY